MTTPTPIGSQLDELGLVLSLGDGERVLEAEVSAVTTGGHADIQHGPIRVPKPATGQTPVPHPIETRIVTVVTEGQDISDEQRARVCAWLTANNIDAALVAQNDVVVQCKAQGDRESGHAIGFHQIYRDPDGRKVYDPMTRDVVMFQRWVPQTVALDPEPAPQESA
ncbi:hypothetical protein ACFQ6Q_00440 [Streptomyces sp. NPDC056437]|uniref:hypothetical protein n=1 Tax=Streptomyces sp. NPDC056437 TaxID=3345816 RepID=UPI00367B0361